MQNTDLVFKLFPELSDIQVDQLSSLGDLYQEWNTKVNVISRKDIDEFYIRHVLHSLLIAKFIDLKDAKVMDVGTGGGFPGVPLAILFPEAHFTLVDSIGKKLKVVEDVSNTIGLKNIITKHERMENLKGSYDYVTGRAVKPLPQVFGWTKHLINWDKGQNFSGMVYLKGGDFNDEFKSIPRKAKLFDLAPIVPAEPFFETKKLVHIYQAKS